MFYIREMKDGGYYGDSVFGPFGSRCDAEHALASLLTSDVVKVLIENRDSLLILEGGARDMPAFPPSQEVNDLERLEHCLETLLTLKIKSEIVNKERFFDLLSIERDKDVLAKVRRRLEEMQ